MASDRARDSYDETRRYRSVVMQQGRVTLEADWNEAQVIGLEEERREALDFIGPAGTPDDGYKVIETGTAPAIAFDFQVGNPEPTPNTMYVGGLRVSLNAPVHYATQLDWLDHGTDGDWVDLAAIAKSPGHEWIGLVLQEREVSTVEDTALREMALGGPDTAQRSRVLQHIVRVATNASDCPGGLISATTKWAAQGLTPDPATMRLNSGATLMVSFPKTKQPPDPCAPQPVGGYLGADNQMIRVQIASVDNSGNAHLLWGYDNASFLYRLSVQDANNVKLLSAPPDVFRQPRENQVVEILRAAAWLSSTDYVAAYTGSVFALGNKPYDPDYRIVTLPGTGLPPVFLDDKATPAVFLRVWEETQPVKPGVPILLGETGLEVTLQAGGGVFHVGDYWQFAVRPSTPTEIYPRRFLSAAQPPDGPRLWFCPLAVVQWNAGVLKVVADCRNQFDNLVTLTRTRLGGCCTVTVRPDDLVNGTTLKSIVDRYQNRERMTICLLPGHYKLDQPLRLGAAHSNITIEACHDGAVLEAADGAQNNFIDGLVVLDHANNVTLRGLRFHLPQVPFVAAGGRFSGLDSATTRQMQGALLNNVFVSVGVRAVHCAVLAVQDCLFRFSLTENQDVFGVGLFCGSECWGLRLERNRFLHEEDYLRSTGPLFRFLAGFALAPTALSRTPKAAGKPGFAAGTAVAAVPGFQRSLLHNAIIQGNEFQGLSIACFAIAEFGTIRAAANTVRDCDAGFWFLSLRLLVLASQVRNVTASAGYLPAGRLLAGLLHAMMTDTVVELGTALTLAYPLPAFTSGVNVVGVDLQSTQEQVAQALKRHLQTVFNRILPTLAESVAPAGRAAKIAQTPAAQPAAAAETQTRNAATTETLALDTARATKATSRIAALHTHVLDIAQAAMAPGQSERMAMAMTLTGNDIDTVIAKASGSAGLVVADDERDTKSTVVLSANTVRAFSPNMPAVLIMLPEACTATGNIIANTDTSTEGARSFVLFPLPDARGAMAAAVTGNVFQGMTHLPIRPVTDPVTPPPMDRWLFFNTAL